MKKVLAICLTAAIILNMPVSVFASEPLSEAPVEMQVEALTEEAADEVGSDSGEELNSEPSTEPAGGSGEWSGTEPADESSTELADEPSTESVDESNTEPTDSPDAESSEVPNSEQGEAPDSEQIEEQPQVMSSSAAAVEGTDEIVTFSTNGWRSISGKSYYYKNGVAVTGFQSIGTHTYYFMSGSSPKGQMLTGFHTLNGKQYYFLKTGAAGVKGRMLTGFQNIDGKLYYFMKSAAKKGQMLIGWQTIDKKTYYFQGSAAKRGQALTGWQTMNGHTYYFMKSEAKKGQLLTGWQTIDGKTYYFMTSEAKKGQMLTGWQTMNGKKYYFLKSGTSKGAMQTGTITMDGKRYVFDSKGVFLREESLTAQDISKYTVSLSASTYTYSGKENKPTVTVYNSSGTKLVQGKDYTVSYSNNTNAGTATATASGIGNYKGKASKTFKINKVSAQFSTKISATNLTVGGSTAKVTVSRLGDGKLTYSSDNAKVATVSSTGVVTAVAAGTVNVSVKCAESTNYLGGSASFKLQVSGTSTVKYTYKMFFLNNYNKYTGIGIPVYIKTNNPDPKSIYVDGIGGTVIFSQGGFDDVKYTGNNHDSLMSVSGGYIICVTPKQVGSNEIRIRERINGDLLTSAKLSFTAADGSKGYDNWVNDIIAKSTKSSNTFDQNMNSVCSYILKNYKYPTNNYQYATDWRYVRLITEYGATWEKKQLDSATSPALLAAIAKKLDPNCKVEYISGVDHSSVYLTPSGGTKKKYNACPYMTTNNMDLAKVVFVNFSNYK